MSVNTDIVILLVEDAGVMRKMEGKVLNSLGYENIIEAEDGNSAITKLESTLKIDLIISDWNMPNKDGFELLEWVRKSEKFKTTPFLMATGRGEKKEVAKAIEAGVSSFISKPFNATELKVKIEEAFGLNKEDKGKIKEKSPIKMGASGKPLLNIAHIQITDHLVLGVLKYLINSGEIIPQHFELETHCMSGWNPVAESLDSGTMDAACVIIPIAMDLFHYGAPLKLIMLTHKNGSIFVRNKKGGEFTEPYQDFFKGKSFYIPHSMSIHHMLAHMFFKGIGINPGVSGKEAVDVSFEVVPPIKMPEFLANNTDSCGYMVAEPIGTKAIASGIAELQFLSSEMWDNHPCCGLVMRQEFIDQYPDAVYEFAKYLVQAGKLIEQNPNLAAEIAVNFLDPDKSLGLKVSLLKNVLTEPAGIKTSDLFPIMDDFDRIQRYMHFNMGVGSIIDINSFVDLRFAKTAYSDRVVSDFPKALDILYKHKLKSGEQKAKALLNKEGKYLMFVLDNQILGIEILKIIEISKMVHVRQIPHAPEYVMGVIDFRGKVIPIMDVRYIFGMDKREYDNKNYIIILEVDTKVGHSLLGIAVDGVSEIINVKATDIEEAPSMIQGLHESYILAMLKTDSGVKILIDIQKVLDQKEAKTAAEAVIAHN